MGYFAHLYEKFNVTGTRHITQGHHKKQGGEVEEEDTSFSDEMSHCYHPNHHCLRHPHYHR